MKASVKTWIFLLVLSILVILAGTEIWGRDGLLWSVTIALSINTLLFMYDDFRLVPRLEAEEINGQDPWGLTAITKNLAEKARIPRPRLHIVADDTPQALAFGRSWSRSHIFLTEGLLKQFSREELTAVVAYQVACIKNMDILSFTITGAFLDVFVSLGHAMDWLLRLILGSKRKPTVSEPFYFFGWVLTPFLGALAHLSIGRHSYFYADQTAAQLCGDPKALASALWKLGSYAETQPLKPEPALAHMFMVNPLLDRGLLRLFHVQPRVESRIKRLLGYYPL